ncbi:hypothetical protein B0H21DRAFT_829211 [Amylocystis lapponica]|nr:hypothetical protein B0H21DRAFT_829211 [Amylocystis lapponica]
MCYQIEHCIEEWSTGSLRKAAFRETDNKERYITHLKDLDQWQQLNPAKIRKICKHMHDRARNRSGAPEDAVTNGRLSAAALEEAKKDLELQTGETDSE